MCSLSPMCHPFRLPSLASRVIRSPHVATRHQIHLCRLAVPAEFPPRHNISRLGSAWRWSDDLSCSATLVRYEANVRPTAPEANVSSRGSGTRPGRRKISSSWQGDHRAPHKAHSFLEWSAAKRATIHALLPNSREPIRTLDLGVYRILCPSLSKMRQRQLLTAQSRR